MYSGSQQGELNREVAALHSDHTIEVPLYLHKMLSITMTWVMQPCCSAGGVKPGNEASVSFFENFTHRFHLAKHGNLIVQYYVDKLCRFADSRR